MANNDEIITDDDIIAAGLIKVREGILSGNWESVCEGYNSISGEELKPFVQEKPKSRLDNIRNLMALEDDGEPDKKPRQKRAKKPKPETDHNVDEETGAILLPEVTGNDDEEMPVLTKRFKGGKRFASKGFEVIQTPVSADERERNEKVAKLKPKLPAKPRDTKIRDTSNDASKDWRFHDVNRPPSMPEKE